jgi:biopolymer transport protein ExbB
MNLLEMFIKGGIIMWPILLSSVIGLAIIVDKFVVLNKAKTNIVDLMHKIRQMIKKKDIEGAIDYCNQLRTPGAGIIKAGLRRIKFGHQRVREAIEDAGQQEIFNLEKGLNALATVAGVAPMLGFLGTVTGMVSAFATIEKLQGSASPSDLAGGIWEALITTVFGLIIGIIALTFYNYFVGRIQKFIKNLEVALSDFIDLILEIDIKSLEEDDLKKRL